MLLHVVGGVALDASRRAAQCNAILALMPIASQKLPSMELYAAILPSDVRESGEMAGMLSQVASVCNCGGCSAAHRVNQIGAVVGPLLQPWLESTRQNVFAAVHGSKAEIVAAVTTARIALLGFVPHLLRWLRQNEKQPLLVLELTVRNQALGGLASILKMAKESKSTDAAAAAEAEADGEDCCVQFGEGCAKCFDIVCGLLKTSTSLETSHVRALLEVLLVTTLDSTILPRAFN